ncbi:PEPxxWA-CTERM sorting domain-containing protein [Sphingomonas sp.]|uniref:PEPxxWA-CTERM sorting domain-containing protein n=1 Tax=Sphingomonas sp. TaxID=28214 RepID=UPI002DBB3A87|nr:PEPxxWA-CTERM sorting domain-containing protein [Sphingomonas sp.]HEU4968473.1 PEPxxWA-CTERM sorting domain-containing protein [Sphingomonas sp.]
MRKLVLTALAATAFAAPAGASIVYSNNFDAENGGNTALNYNSFDGLTVTDGTVDLVKSGDFGISCPGGAGACVDLDGSTGNSGLVSSNSYAFNAGERVALSLLFSGNQRGAPSDNFSLHFYFATPVSGTYGYRSGFFGNVDFGTFTDVPELRLSFINIPPNFAATDVTFFFDPANGGSATFALEDLDNDNVGIVIDNLALSVGAIPEPATWAMVIAGFGLAGMAVRRRRPALAIA